MVKQPKFSKASLSQSIAVHRLLTDNLLANKDGTFSYKNGWTDEWVAQETNAPIASVRRIRNEMFGPLRKKHNNTPESRLDVIEAFLNTKFPNWSIEQ